MRQGRNKSSAAGAVPTDARLGAALERFAEVLARKGLRLTRPRSAIVEAVLARQGHFPIEELVRDLRARGIRGSKATVYRALPLLGEAGILHPAMLGGDERRYETAFGREHHDHLVCRGCGAVVEFEDAGIEALQRVVAARHGFTLEAHQHRLVGQCPRCRVAETASREHPTPTRAREEKRRARP